MKDGSSAIWSFLDEKRSEHIRIVRFMSNGRYVQDRVRIGVGLRWIRKAREQPVLHRRLDHDHLAENCVVSGLVDEYVDLSLDT
jgi:hypothetical protein